MILTDKELTFSRQLQEQLDGVTFDEATHALAHARGVVSLQRSDKADEVIFHPIGADSP